LLPPAPPLPPASWPVAQASTSSPARPIMTNEYFKLPTGSRSRLGTFDIPRG
jgi:hypothetical protein